MDFFQVLVRWNVMPLRSGNLAEPLTADENLGTLLRRQVVVGQLADRPMVERRPSFSSRVLAVATITSRHSS